MVIANPYLILLPLILLALGGYICSWLFALSEDTLVRVVTDFFMPMLVFYSLYTSSINLNDTMRLGGAVSFVLLFLLIASLIYCHVFNLDKRAFLPPIVFINTGFLGIPLMGLWGGAGEVNQIVIYDQIQTFYIFTLGIFIVAGGFTFSGLMEILKTPLLWSIILGFWCRYANIDIPQPFLDACKYSGAGAPALATFALGCSLRKHRLRADPHLISGLLMRFGLGFIAGMLAVNIFGITGSARIVVVSAATLPSAVFSVILPLRYGVDSRFAGAMVLLSTLLSILTIPFVFYLSSKI
ncbi:MAG: AEC family transporter [Desulfobacterales bacterium]|nr:AEC family transporter [Desulfobacterales bacterium]